MKIPNFSLVKLVALSETNISGKPRLANDFLNSSTVAVVVVEDVILHSLGMCVHNY